MINLNYFSEAGIFEILPDAVTGTYLYRISHLIVSCGPPPPPAARASRAFSGLPSPFNMLRPRDTPAIDLLVDVGVLFANAARQCAEKKDISTMPSVLSHPPLTIHHPPPTPTYCTTDSQTLKKWRSPSEPLPTRA